MTDDSISGYAAGLLAGQREISGPAPRRPMPIPTGEFAKFEKLLAEQFGVGFVLVEVNRAENYAYIRIDNKPAKVPADLTVEEYAALLGFTEELREEMAERRARELANRPLTNVELHAKIAALETENAELKKQLADVQPVEKSEPAPKGQKTSK